MRSRTIDQLRHLLNHLPRRRRSALWMLVPLSFVPGVIDLASVAVIARLTGSLVDSDLEDRLPGIHVFCGDSVNQSVWMILVFILLAWGASLSKISLKFFQQRLSAGIWRDISDEVHSRLLQQPFEYYYQQRY